MNPVVRMSVLCGALAGVIFAVISIVTGGSVLPSILLAIVFAAISGAATYVVTIWKAGRRAGI